MFQPEMLKSECIYLYLIIKEWSNQIQLKWWKNMIDAGLKLLIFLQLETVKTATVSLLN